MQTIKRQLVAASLIGAAAAIGPVASAMAAPDMGGAMKLEGACVARVPGSLMQWSYVLIPANSGRNATLHGTIDVEVNLPGIPTGGTSSPIIGTVSMTGPITGKFNTMWYVLMPAVGDFSSQVVAIGRSSGEIEFTGAGKVKSLHRMAFYAPQTDVNQDGFPDDGAQPFYQLPPFESFDTCMVPGR